MNIPLYRKDYQNLSILNSMVTKDIIAISKMLSSILDKKYQAFLIHHGFRKAIEQGSNAKNYGNKLFTLIVLPDILAPSTGSLGIMTKVKSVIAETFLNKILAISKIKTLL